MDDLLYPPYKLKTPITIGTLFSGIGTPEMALKRITSNYKILFKSEVDKHAIKNHELIHGQITNLGDIRHIAFIPPVDILHHSPPCQDISIVGQMKGANIGTRSGLMYETIRILKATKIKPKVIIMEQVPTIINPIFAKDLHTIQVELDLMGYSNYVYLLKASNYGTPQKRIRAFMISVPNGYAYHEPERIQLRYTWQDTWETDMEILSQHYLTPSQYKTFTTNSSPLYDRKARFLNGLGREDLHLAQTLTTRGDRLTDNFIKDDKGIRRITPLEAWRIMDISDEDFQKVTNSTPKTILYKQAGNAIVVSVYEAILRQLIE